MALLTNKEPFLFVRQWAISYQIKRRSNGMSVGWLTKSTEGWRVSIPGKPQTTHATIHQAKAAARRLLAS